MDSSYDVSNHLANKPEVLELLKYERMKESYANENNIFYYEYLPGLYIVRFHYQRMDEHYWNEMAELNDLFIEGIITEEEYEAATEALENKEVELEAMMFHPTFKEAAIDLIMMLEN